MNNNNSNKNINDLYFEKTNQRKSADKNRLNLAFREIKTLEILKDITSGNFLHRGSSVVDLGCGDKHLEEAFNKINVSYFGYDIDMINLEYDKIPLPNDSQDLIVSFAVIEHLNDPHNMLKESLRCLKKGGSILMCTPNFKYSFKTFYDDYTHVKAYTPASLTCLLKDIGFSDIYDFPNLRCKSKFAYVNKYRYLLANARPFSANPPMSSFIPGFLKGKSKGMFVMGKKI